MKKYVDPYGNSLSVVCYNHVEHVGWCLAWCRRGKVVEEVGGVRPVNDICLALWNAMSRFCDTLPDAQHCSEWTPFIFDNNATALRALEVANHVLLTAVDGKRLPDWQIAAMAHGWRPPVERKA